MRFTRSRLFFLVFIGALACFSLARAETGEKEGAAESTPKVGGGADREWAKRSSKINVYETQIKEATRRLQDLIRAKNEKRHAVDEKGNPVDLLQEITATHKELLAAVKNYNTEKAELHYRFPERGALIERRYVPFREQSVEQIEKEMGLDGELTKIKKKIDKKYSTFTEESTTEAPPKVQPRAPTVKKTKDEDEAPKRLKLSM